MLILFLYILKTLRKLKLISFIFEGIHNGIRSDIKVKKGILNIIYFVDTQSHFQIPKYLNKIDLPINQDKLFEKIKIVQKNHNFFAKEYSWDKICFIHIRRGDYIFYPNKDFPAVLNYQWYLKAINLMEGKFKIKKFIICTDDKNYFHDLFSSDERFTLFHQGVLEDLLIMGKCRYGILSASSLSWWASKISRFNYKGDNFFLAPKYWINHRNKKWLNYKFKFEWINYI